MAGGRGAVGGVLRSSRVGLVALCLCWYMSSALSSNTSKGLLSRQHAHGAVAPAVFPYPVTLTLVQFVFVNVYCYLGTRRAVLGELVLSRLTVLSRRQLLDVAQISLFNVVGHALSSVAISRVPVSMVHTIKALSPLFTVLSYAYLFDVSYPTRTYVALVPLMLGVVLACSSLTTSVDDVVGLGAALGSTLIFVIQNIYSAKLLKPAAAVSTAPSGKLDKINILFYSSACSVVLMLPLCAYYDLARMASADAPPLGVRAMYLLCVNGGVHFAQNLLAFQVLAHVAPVTYSIASLFKRVFIILIAIAWFGQHVTLLQWTGIVLTFAGLYLYNQAKPHADGTREKTAALPMHTHALPTHAPRARPRQVNLATGLGTPHVSLPPP